MKQNRSLTQRQLALCILGYETQGMEAHNPRAFLSLEGTWFWNHGNSSGKVMFKINAKYSIKDLLVNLLDFNLTLKAACQISG